MAPVTQCASTSQSSAPVLDFNGVASSPAAPVIDFKGVAQFTPSACAVNSSGIGLVAAIDFSGVGCSALTSSSVNAFGVTGALPTPPPLNFGGVAKFTPTPMYQAQYKQCVINTAGGVVGGAITAGGGVGKIAGAVCGVVPFAQPSVPVCAAVGAVSGAAVGGLLGANQAFQTDACRTVWGLK